MPEYDNELRGVLFHNKEKRTENSPDYSGVVTVDSVEYKLAGWIKTSKGGQKFLSLKATHPNDPVLGSGGATNDEELPF